MPKSFKVFYLVYAILSVAFMFSGFLKIGGQIILIALSVVIFFTLKLYSEKQTRQERVIRECEERYKSFLENSKEGIWRFELTEPMSFDLSLDEQVRWIHEKGYFAECNTAFANMYDLTKEQIEGKPLSFNLDKLVVSEVLLKTFINKNYYLRDIELVMKERSYLLSLYGTTCGQKLIRGWGSQKDITQFKQYTTEREKLLETAKEAKTLAELANAEKDRILANLSHELRTPLVSIIGYSEILRSGETVEETAHGLEIINRNAKAQLQLIEDLLSVSKAKENKTKLNKERFNLKDVITHKVESLKYKYIAKNIDVILEGEDLVVFGDQLKIGQIFSNLFANALKFTEKGKVVVSWGLGESNSYYFSVSDSGVGIAEEDLKNLFMPYFQVDKGITKSTQGVGLGLFIAKTFTNLHKGRIEVTSTIGKGSTFTVKLPMNGNDLRLLSKSLEGLHVLVVEDDDNVGEVVKLLLEREGTIVTLVTSAESARLVLKHETFDLYLFDIAMPKEDGITLLRGLRDSGDTTPAVAASAYNDFEQQCLDAGFNAFILKPITIEKLNELRSVLH